MKVRGYIEESFSAWEIPLQEEEHEPQAVSHRARRRTCRAARWMRRLRLARDPLDDALPGISALLVSTLGTSESDEAAMYETWVPRIRSARAPRLPRGEIAVRWVSGLSCVAILIVLLIVG